MAVQQKQLEDWQTMAECGISDEGGVTPMLILLLRLRGGGFSRYYLNPEYFDPKFNRDFRNKKDVGTVYYRGKHVYKRPYGSMRYAIKVLDKYRHNGWLSNKEGIRPNINNEREQVKKIVIFNDHTAEILPLANAGDNDNTNHSNRIE